MIGTVSKRYTGSFVYVTPLRNLVSRPLNSIVSLFQYGTQQGHR
jgi:hypothetical protein